MCIALFHRLKITEIENIDRYLNFAREIKKAVKFEDDEDIICWLTWNDP